MSGHHGTCHCGAVQLTLQDDPAEVTECNCSLCRRCAGLWHYCRPDLLSVSGEVQGYVQGDRTLTTWHCKTCACVTHWTALDAEYGKVGVNLRMFDPGLWGALPRRLVDGAGF